MKKTSIIFVLLIFMPALILGGLALRAALEQRMVIEGQEAVIRQEETDALASRIRLALSEQHRQFEVDVLRMLKSQEPKELAQLFNHIGQKKGKFYFAVDLKEGILSPISNDVEDNRQFLIGNKAFLGKGDRATVYNTYPGIIEELANSVSREDGAKLKQIEEDIWEAKRGVSSKIRSRKGRALSAKKKESFIQQDSILEESIEGEVDGNLVFDSGEDGGMALEMLTLTDESKRQESAPGARDYKDMVQTGAGEYGGKDSSQMTFNIEQSKGQAQASISMRRVMPQQRSQAKQKVLMAEVQAKTSDFKSVVREGSEGILTRFVEDQLQIFFWLRPQEANHLVYGMRVLPEDLRELLQSLLRGKERRLDYSRAFSDDEEVCMALLDDRGVPFVKTNAAFQTDWKRPFVATEIGEVLPHWEATLYFINPSSLADSAKLVSMTLISLIALALGAIAVGSFFVVADVRRELALVHKKTDFVSNVSHELKTPLTSIRMFAELLQNQRVDDKAKEESYLRVIVLEAERLTRLINNVLDFSKMERNQKVYHKAEIDLYEVLDKVWEGIEMHLKNKGFDVQWNAQEGPYPIYGDDDALAQVFVNLLSNAEKYSGEVQSVELHSYMIEGEVRVCVLDRGLGVPEGEEKKIFDHFYRAHDLLSSGIQGSGLGLTLASRIVRDHGGKILYFRRDGGGSSFEVRLPFRQSLSGYEVSRKV